MINKFQMMANSQFIENRAYDEEPEEVSFNNSKQSNQEKNTNDQSNVHQNLLQTIKDSLSNSFKFIDDNFTISEKVNSSQNESDDDEDYITDNLSAAILNNAFNRNPLPYIIGSEEFISDMVFSQGDDAIETDKIDSNVKAGEREYISDSSEYDDDDFERDFPSHKAESSSVIFNTLAAIYSLFCSFFYFIQ